MNRSRKILLQIACSCDQTIGGQSASLISSTLRNYPGGATFGAPPSCIDAALAAIVNRLLALRPRTIDEHLLHLLDGTTLPAEVNNRVAVRADRQKVVLRVELILFPNLRNRLQVMHMN